MNKVVFPKSWPEVMPCGHHVKSAQPKKGSWKLLAIDEIVLSFWLAARGLVVSDPSGLT